VKRRFTKTDWSRRYKENGTVFERTLANPELSINTHSYKGQDYSIGVITTQYLQTEKKVNKSKFYFYERRHPCFLEKVEEQGQGVDSYFRKIRGILLEKGDEVFEVE
jgi:hypothetical protein